MFLTLMMYIIFGSEKLCVMSELCDAFQKIDYS